MVDAIWKERFYGNQIALKMRKPAWVFDARSITNKEKVIKSGLNLWRLGDGSKAYNPK